MPCKLFLTGDSEPIWLAEAPDVLLERVTRGLIDLGHDIEDSPMLLVRAEMLPLAHDEPSRVAYFSPKAITAVLSMDPREVECYLDNPPSWLEA